MTALLTVFPYLGLIAMVMSLSHLLPLGVSFFHDDGATQAFVISMIVNFAVGCAMWLGTHHNKRDLTPRDGILLVVLAWWDNGIRNITNSKRPIVEPADLPATLPDELVGPVHRDVAADGGRGVAAVKPDAVGQLGCADVAHAAARHGRCHAAARRLVGTQIGVELRVAEAAAEA